jgi:protein-S-isoprenylcysteine O-methyltransferase Ste14
LVLDEGERNIGELGVSKVQADHANVRIAPPILTLLHIIGAFLLARFIPLPFVVPPIIKNFGFALVVIGFLLGLGAVLAFRRARTTLDPYHPVSSIVTSGIYGFSRNPIYLSFLLMVIGIPLNTGTYWGIILAPLFILFCNKLVIEHEEAYLEKKFGETYTSYKSRVRRWL